jgi:hypothetical protein
MAEVLKPFCLVPLFPVVPGNFPQHNRKIAIGGQSLKRPCTHEPHPRREGHEAISASAALSHVTAAVRAPIPQERPKTFCVDHALIIIDRHDDGTFLRNFVHYVYTGKYQRFFSSFMRAATIREA